MLNSNLWKRSHDRALVCELRGGDVDVGWMGIKELKPVQRHRICNASLDDFPDTVVYGRVLEGVP
jgi:hypothetical protein